MKRLFAILLLLVPGSAFAKPILSSADLSASEDRAQIELVFSKAPSLHIFYLAQPYRIVIDMDALDWQARNVKLSKGDVLATGLRYGVPKDGISRLVIDLSVPARVASARYGASEGTAKSHLTIILQPVSAAQFQQAMERGKSQDRDQKTAEPGSTAEVQPMRAQTPKASVASSSTSVKSSWSSSLKVLASTTGQDKANSGMRLERQALLTNVDTGSLGNQDQVEREGHIGFTSPDGYFITYMHPGGSLLGGGVSIGTQF